MQLSNNNVYTFKMTSGEEIVAKVVEQTSSEIFIENPVSVTPTQTGMGFVPSVFTIGKDIQVQINTVAIAMAALTDENIKMKYIEATTGIKVQSSKIIV